MLEESTSLEALERRDRAGELGPEEEPDDEEKCAACYHRESEHELDVGACTHEGCTCSSFARVLR